MKYDHDILYQFIPTDHKQRFLTWNNAYQSIEGINIVGVYTVHYGDHYGYFKIISVE